MSQREIHCAKGPLLGDVLVPGSKSLSNRALLIAALAEGVSHLRGLLWSDDTEACFVALQSLGVPIQKIGEDELRVTGVKAFSANQRIAVTRGQSPVF